MRGLDAMAWTVTVGAGVAAGIAVVHACRLVVAWLATVLGLR